MNTITLDDALKLLEKVDEGGNPIPAAIEFISCDLSRNKGGQRIVYSQAVLVMSNLDPVKDTPKKKAYNYRHNTRNIKGLGNEQVRSFHPLLLIKINGKEVVI